jgi:hypothetical protein
MPIMQFLPYYTTHPLLKPAVCIAVPALPLHVHESLLYRGHLSKRSSSPIIISSQPGPPFAKNSKVLG